MKKKQTNNLWLAFCLSLGVFASCSEDRNEPSSASESGESVTLGLYAEVSVDDAEARAINYKLGKNAKDQIVPLPQFTDKQIVEVHTIIKSNKSTTPVVQTLKWRYDAESKKLILAPTDKDSSKDENNIVIDNFNNDSGTKWYISGLIGGTRSDNSTQVSFEGARVLNGVEGNVGEAVGSLNVPYAFGWTELTIDTKDTNNTKANGSYKYANVPSNAKVKLAPLGSLIAYKLGTNQKAGAYTFMPSGFIVNSNSFGDQGVFELNTDIPTSSATQVALPTWTETALSSLVYTFAKGQEPGTIAHGKSASKTYYAWVMSHKTQPAEVNTRVILKGSSNRPETNGFKDYTKTWFTDYTTKSTQLVAGRVHKLTANATHTYLLPIEYVAEYNLAGGEGLTHTISGTSSQPVGVTGNLRFANSHRNDASGYYNWYTLKGYRHDRYNPEGKSLQAEIDKGIENAPAGESYYVPTLDQWWGVYPKEGRLWTDRNEYLDQREYMAFGPGSSPGADLLRLSYLSDYSKVYYGDTGTGTDTRSDAYIYAIRFKAPNNKATVADPWEYDVATGLVKSYIYPSVSDNSLKCAYRYRRVGGSSAWTARNLSSQLIIDVVYLGEEAKPTSLEDISKGTWWDAKQAAGLVISRTFSASGNIYDLNQNSPSQPISTTLQKRGEWIDYWTSSQMNLLRSWRVQVNKQRFPGYDNWNHSDAFYPVRLFKR